MTKCPADLDLLRIHSLSTVSSLGLAAMLTPEARS
jgi:hypothetical protein